MTTEECLPCKAKKMEFLGSTFPIGDSMRDDLVHSVITSRVDHTPLLNCLSWNLYFQKLNKDFRIYYNGDHVISLHNSITPPSGYEDLSSYGFPHLSMSFNGLLSSDEEDMLYDYIDTNITASRMFEIKLDDSYIKDGVYEFVFDGSVLQIPFPTFRFSAFTKEHALDLLPNELKPTLIELSN